MAGIPDYQRVTYHFRAMGEPSAAQRSLLAAAAARSSPHVRQVEAVAFNGGQLHVTILQNDKPGPPPGMILRAHEISALIDMMASAMAAAAPSLGITRGLRAGTVGMMSDREIGADVGTALREAAAETVQDFAQAAKPALFGAGVAAVTIGALALFLYARR